MAKKGKGKNSWKEDYYSRHESLEAKLQHTKSILDKLDKSRGAHQQSTPPPKKEEEIPANVSAYEERRRTGFATSTAVIE